MEKQSHSTFALIVPREVADFCGFNNHFLWKKGWPFQNFWFPFSWRWFVWYRWINSLIRSPKWFQANLRIFVVILAHIFRKRMCWLMHVTWFSFSSGVICVIQLDGKTGPFYVHLPSEKKQTHSTIIVVQSKISDFCGSNPIMIHASFEVPIFQGSDLRDIDRKNRCTTFALVFPSEISIFCVFNPNILWKNGWEYWPNFAIFCCFSFRKREF